MVEQLSEQVQWASMLDTHLDVKPLLIAVDTSWLLYNNTDIAQAYMG